MNIFAHVLKGCLWDKFLKVELLGTKVFTFLKALVTNISLRKNILIYT